METLYKIDQFILQKFQTVQDFFQEWTGATCFLFARMFLLLAYALGAFSSFIAIIMKEEYSQAGIFIAISSGICAYWFLFVGRVEKSTLENLQTRNPLEETFGLFRILLLGFVIWDLPSILEVATFDIITVEDHIKRLRVIGNATWSVSFAFCIYFLGCTPKPPSKSKFRKLAESLLGTRQTVNA
jgi:hypothetical protein